MSLVFTADQNGRSKIVLLNEPDYIVPLPIAPSRMEDCLLRGKWLCLGMSVWSSHDILAGAQAIDRIRPRGGLVRLGLRPVDFPVENETWIGAEYLSSSTEPVEIMTTQHHGSLKITICGQSNQLPVWVGLSKGAIISVRHGQLLDSEIDDLISQVIAAV